jgi:hypothetical protein
MTTTLACLAGAGVSGRVKMVSRSDPMADRQRQTGPRTAVSSTLSACRPHASCLVYRAADLSDILDLNQSAFAEPLPLAKPLAGPASWRANSAVPGTYHLQNLRPGIAKQNAIPNRNEAKGP